MSDKGNRSKIFLLIAVTALLALSGCSELGYYLQCAKGQLELMQSATPIAELLDDSTLQEPVRMRLKTTQEIRDFATRELLLPDNESYRRYADLNRPFAVWNIVATEEFSLEPKKWCFPIAGCVSYRGYFQQNSAEKMASALQCKNMDVDVYGVQAYSTLNWFDDPVLNTFLFTPEPRLAGLIFHELAHQLIYVKGDSPFNEAFAQTVQIEGVKRWLESRQDPQQWAKYRKERDQQRLFQNFLRQTRGQLQYLYSRSDLTQDELRQQKRRIIHEALDRFEALKNQGVLDQRFDRWMAKGLNNARLASVATYYELLPAFQALLAAENHNLTAFYGQVKHLSTLPPEQRRQQLTPPTPSTLGP